jgi:hypothetical protein
VLGVTDAELKLMAGPIVSGGRFSPGGWGSSGRGTALTRGATMSEPSSGGVTTQGRLSTEDVARPGAGSEAGTATDSQPDGRTDTEPDSRTDTEPDSRTDTEPDSRTDMDASPASLLASERREQMIDRWQEIQTAFVDQPQQAVQDADGLVADLMQQLAEGFAAERRQLEAQWSRGDQISTEELRLNLRRYRSFFQRLLSV